MLVYSPDSYYRMSITLTYIIKRYNVLLAYNHIFVDEYYIKYNINTAFQRVPRELRNI